MKRVLRRKLPAFLLAAALLTGLVPAASAASADINRTVKPGKSITLDDDDFQDFLEDEGKGDIAYVRIKDCDEFDDYGYFSARDADNSSQDFDQASELEDVELYVYSKDAESEDGYLLQKGLTFTASSKSDDGYFEVEFTAYDDDDRSASGTMRIEVDDEDGDDDDGDITLSVKADGEETVSEKSFRTYFEKKRSSSSESFKYMYFYDVPGSLYSNGHFESRNDRDREVEIDEDDIESSSTRFYYDTDPDDLVSSGHYTLSDLTFYADDDADKKSFDLGFYVVGDNNSSYKGTLTVKISAQGSSASSSKKGDITYSVAPGKEKEFDEGDFYDLFEDEYKDGDFTYLEFTDSSGLTSSSTVYYRYDDNSHEKKFTASSIDDYYFYYDEDDIDDDDFEEDCFPLEDLSFVAGNSFTGYVELEFTLHGKDEDGTSREVDGNLIINSTKNSTGVSASTVSYSVAPGRTVTLNEDDFEAVFHNSYGNYDLLYVQFSAYSSLGGSFYSRYGAANQVELTTAYFQAGSFYYDEDDLPSGANCYLLENISFVSNSSFTGSLSIPFVAFGSGGRRVAGTLMINSTVAGGTGSTGIGSSLSSYLGGDIRYTTTGANVQINANDISRFFSKAAPGYTLQYVLLSGVPTQGGLYYNYYNASSYGSPTSSQMTAYNINSRLLYASPASTGQYSLSELTYVPSGINYCVTIPFTAHGTGAITVSGTIIISVTSRAVSEIYGVTARGSAVNFPAAQVSSAVSAATGSMPYSIQLLKLPSYSVGYMYCGNALASTSIQYTYGNSMNPMSSLRFVPNTTYTGSVEIPYVALDSFSRPMAVGMFSLGVVNTRRSFTDVTASTWCYKYVMELSDAGVISGYSNGSFRPDGTLTYGAALKLIMRAAGYPEQAPTTKNVFSGYLARAQADGIVGSGNVNLNGAITRLQVAQIAAKALRLNTATLSSVKPFTDTSDASVQALNAAGIVEGYFSNGTSTFKPNNTLTRGQISAIVWRIKNYT